MTAERLEHYRYDPESGRLRQRIPDRAYEYDAGGRTTEDGRLRYRYGAEGRLAEITRAATGQRQAAYRYNALGERVRKLGTRVTYYHYDLEGRLLAETDASGQTRAEYLYLGHAPLALSRSGQLYYYHNDHLGTPQKLTDGAGQVVWSARYRAFGEASVGAGYVPQNLRFPGQYYDEESGLHYNYHRYYDPDIGRYLTSDPIGLAGGMNTYTYVEGNPLSWSDPFGLRASYCQRPLGDYSGQNGGGPPLFNHQFICVTLPDGTVRCDSTNNPDNDTNPLTPAPGVPSRPDRDNENVAQCENIDDDSDRCFEECVLDQWTRPRPDYAIGPLGTDCQEYSQDIVEICRTRCP